MRLDCLKCLVGSKGLKPQTPNNKPQTTNPKQQTPNPKQQTPNPKQQLKQLFLIFDYGNTKI